MDRCTLRDWVYRYNEFGLEELSRRISASPSHNAGAEGEVAAMDRVGPGLAKLDAERQRLLIARSLLGRPRIPRVDERLISRKRPALTARITRNRRAAGTVRCGWAPGLRKEMPRYPTLPDLAVPLRTVQTGNGKPRHERRHTHDGSADDHIIIHNETFGIHGKTC